MTSDELLLAAWERRWREPSEGWDVTEHARGVSTADPPWSYDDLADEALAGAGSVVDLGTGGGEWLLGRPHLPSETHATEGWPPNLPVARRALEPRGIAVAAYDADAGDALPYDDQHFDLVLDRHEAYDPAEVRRVLRPGGVLLTQQVDGHTMDDLAQVFGGGAPYPAITLAALAAEARDAGLEVDLAQEWSGPIRFAGVSAMVGFLRIMPWQLPEGWTVRGHAAPLLDLHRRHSAGEPLVFTERRFVLRARRPAGDGPEGWPGRGRIGT